MGFDRILGQENATGRLQNLLASEKLPPALLFYGPEGVGKKMAALEMAKALNCSAPSAGVRPLASTISSRLAANASVRGCGFCYPCQAIEKGIYLDVKLVNAAYQAGLLGEEPEKQRNLKVDTIRHLRKDLEKKSLQGPWKIAVVEEAHTLVPEAANALLKILEEPPSHTLWILVTSQRERLLPTVLSRCHSIAFRPLPDSVLEGLLMKQKGIPAERAREMAFFSEGSLERDIEMDAPERWESGSLSPFEMAQSLPRELQAARTRVEKHLFAMSQSLRKSLREPSLARQAYRIFGELQELRNCLKSNAAPRLILELAVLQMQKRQGNSG